MTEIATGASTLAMTYILLYEIAASGKALLAILATLVAFAHYVRSAKDNVYPSLRA